MGELNRDAFRELPEDIQRDLAALSARQWQELFTFMRRGQCPRSPELHDIYYKLLPHKDELFED